MSDSDNRSMSTPKYVFYEIAYSIVWIILYLTVYYLTFGLLITNVAGEIIRIPNLSYFTGFLYVLVEIVFSILFSILCLFAGILPSLALIYIFKKDHSKVTSIILKVFIVCIAVHDSLLIFMNSDTHITFWWILAFNIGAWYSVEIIKHRIKLKRKKEVSKDIVNEKPKNKTIDDSVESFVSSKTFNKEKKKFIITLFSAVAIAVLLIVMFYENRVISNKEKSIEAENAELNNRISSLNDEVKKNSDYRTQINDLNKKIKDYDSENTELRKDLKSNDYAVSAYRRLKDLAGKGTGNSDFYVDRNIIVVHVAKDTTVKLHLGYYDTSAAFDYDNECISPVWSSESFDSNGDIKVNIHANGTGNSMMNFTNTHNSNSIKVLVIVVP